jgi:hypothetical protein
MGKWGVSENNEMMKCWQKGDGRQTNYQIAHRKNSTKEITDRMKGVGKRTCGEKDMGMMSVGKM